MSKLTRFAALAALAALPLCATAKGGAIQITGADVGVWTHDYEAAAKLAAEKDLPLFLNFTGSDWCGWCKLMDKKVFSTDAWQDWAKDKIVLAYINFPRDPALVPKFFVRRNDELQKKYRIRGYPTYVIVAPDGKTVLGQLGASRDATPEGFIADLEQVLAKQPKNADKKGKAATKDGEKTDAKDGEKAAEKADAKADAK